LALYRTPGQWAKLRAAIFQPTVIYTARINQVFSAWDGILEITYDTGSGTLADVLPDMTLLIGSTAGAHDVGICRLRDKDSNTFFIGETSNVKYMNNQYLTVINDFGLWARHVLIDAGESFMDGGIEYDDQHTDFDPTPIMGGNRVIKLVEGDASATFNFASSYALDSSISGYSCSAPTAASASGMTTATPTIHWDETGWHIVYLTLTAANGKTFFGVRYVFIWDADNLPPRAKINEPRQDADAGGWEFEITLLDECDLDTIRDHALVILFAEDYYGDTNQSIGPLVGCENVLVEGWIGKESIDWDPDQGVVKFTGYGAHYWFQKIAAYPDGVRIVPDTPTAWTQIKRLTVNKGLWHFLRWRTTATRVMDVFLTDNTFYTAEVSSLAQNLWEQIIEMAFLQIFARPGVNAHNQLYIEVHPQLVPEDDRDWPTVMDITKEDWTGTISFDRETVEEVAQVSLSGISVNQNGKGTAYFALSTGHTYGRFGNIETQDRLLVSTQAQTNELCGLYYGWRNNPFKDIPISLAANNRLIDCFPRQKCTITINPEDTPRGISYDGGLIPISVSFIQDDESGYVHTEVSFEAETFAALAVNGDIPGNNDISVPPVDSLPPLIDFPAFIMPGLPEPGGDGPARVILHDTNAGLLYSDNFDETGADVRWRTINAGLEATQYQNINYFFVTPNGALYAAYCDVVDPGNYTLKPFFIARAPSIGATFTVIKSEESIRPSPATGFINWGLFSVGQNKLMPEQVAFVIGQNNVDKKIWIGSGSTFTAGAVVDTASLLHAGLSYGLDTWLHTRLDHYSRISADASAVLSTGTPGIDSLDVFTPVLGHIRASTTGRTFHRKSGGGGYVIGDDNLASVNTITDSDFEGTGFACDPSGMFIMTKYGAGARAKSSDGGATFSALASLPPGNWWWAYAGGEGSNSQWVAAGGSSVRCSLDFGSTWPNKEGDLQQVVPIPSINGVKVVGF
jgi:hypothetical protein